MEAGARRKDEGGGNKEEPWKIMSLSLMRAVFQTRILAGPSGGDQNLTLPVPPPPPPLPLSL